MTPDRIQPGVDHKVVTAVYNVGGNTVPVTVSVELEKGAKLFEAAVISVGESKFISSFAYLEMLFVSTTRNNCL